MFFDPFHVYLLPYGREQGEITGRLDRDVRRIYRTKDAQDLPHNFIAVVDYPGPNQRSKGAFDNYPAVKSHFLDLSKKLHGSPITPDSYPVLILEMEIYYISVVQTFIRFLFRPF